MNSVRHKLARRAAAILLVLSFMMPLAARPAHAMFGEEAAMMYLSMLFDSLAKTADSVVKGWIGGFLTRIKHKNEEMVDEAVGAHKDRLAGAQTAGYEPTIRYGTPRPGQCLNMTNFARTAGAAQAAQDGITDAGDRDVIVNATLGAGSPEVAALRGMCEEQCPYVDPSDTILLNKCKEAGCPEGSGVEPGTAAQADVNPGSLWRGPAYDEQAHQNAANAVCRNLVDNLPDERPSGDNIYSSGQSVEEHNSMLAQESSQAIAKMMCQTVLRARTPADGVYHAYPTTGKAANDPSLNPAYKYLLTGGGWRSVANYPGIGSYHWPPQDSDLSSASSLLMYNENNQPSLQQNQLANLAVTTSPEYQQHLAGPTNHLLAMLVGAKSVTIQQRWLEYENLERQLLVEAANLAQMVRVANRN